MDPCIVKNVGQGPELMHNGLPHQKSVARNARTCDTINNRLNVNLPSSQLASSINVLQRLLAHASLSMHCTKSHACMPSS